MPLHSGSSREVIAKNIHEMVQAGHPHAQAVAAALHNAHYRRKNKKKMTKKGTGAPVSPGTGSGTVGGY